MQRHTGGAPLLRTLPTLESIKGSYRTPGSLRLRSEDRTETVIGGSLRVRARTATGNGSQAAQIEIPALEGVIWAAVEPWLMELGSRTDKDSKTQPIDEHDKCCQPKEGPANRRQLHGSVPHQAPTATNCRVAEKLMPGASGAVPVACIVSPWTVPESLMFTTSFPNTELIPGTW